jgi:hypothetical protein
MEDQLLTLQTCLTHVSQSSHLIVALYFRGLSPDRHTPGLTSRFIKRTRSIPTSIMLLLPHLQAIATIYSSALLILPSNPHTGRLCWLFRDSWCQSFSLFSRKLTVTHLGGVVWEVCLRYPGLLMVIRVLSRELGLGIRWPRILRACCLDGIPLSHLVARYTCSIVFQTKFSIHVQLFITPYLHNVHNGQWLSTDNSCSKILMCFCIDQNLFILEIWIHTSTYLFLPK